MDGGQTGESQPLGAQTAQEICPGTMGVNKGYPFLSVPANETGKGRKVKGVAHGEGSSGDIGFAGKGCERPVS